MPPMTAESIALTFDDGPDPRWTAAILDQLDGLGLAATFFVISARARANPALVERIAAGGHTIALHCREHLRHSECERAAIEADTRAALAELGSLGVRPRLWRTPWGRTAPWTAAIAATNGLTLVPWTLEPHDWRGDSAERMLAFLAPRLASGAIVLLHDGLGPGARRTDCSETVRLLEPLAAAASARALAPRALPEPTGADRRSQAA